MANTAAAVTARGGGGGHGGSHGGGGGDAVGHHEIFAMTVPKLRAALKARGLSTVGVKAELRARLLEAEKEKRDRATAAGAAAAPPAAAPTTAAPAAAVAASSSSSSSSSSSAAAAAAAASSSPHLRPGALGGARAADESHGDAWLGSELDGVYASYSGSGPQTGIFTDGSCEPNPGPGGWGAVHVVDGDVLWSARGCVEAVCEPGSSHQQGGDAESTNNRMELTAIIRALQRVPTKGPGAAATVYSDSDLCVQTLNTWAAGWAANGWVKKSDKKPPKNLELVQAAYALKLARPACRVQWIKAHDGSLWNEYADRLAVSAGRGRVTSVYVAASEAHGGEGD
jgi:ribonuclease HI